MPLFVIIIPELKSLSRDNKHYFICLMIYWYCYEICSGLKQLVFVWLRCDAVYSILQSLRTRCGADENFCCLRTSKFCACDITKAHNFRWYQAKCGNTCWI